MIVPCSVGGVARTARRARIIKACGFEYKTVGLRLGEDTPNAEIVALDGKGLHWGMGYATRSNTEVPARDPRLTAAALGRVHQVVIAPIGEHSEKPDEVYRRIIGCIPAPISNCSRASRDQTGWLGRRTAAARTRRVRWRVRGAPPGREQTKAGDL